MKSSLTVQQDIAAPAASVWQVIGDFARLDWLPDTVITAEGEGVGAMRYSERPGGKVAERLEAYDAAGMSYTYSILSGPVPFTDFLSTITVVPVGASACRVDWVAEFKPDPTWPDGKLQHLMRKMYGAGLAEAKRRVGG
jgi:hypothetical protein